MTTTATTSYDTAPPAASYPPPAPATHVPATYAPAAAAPTSLPAASSAPYAGHGSGGGSVSVPVAGAPSTGSGSGNDDPNAARADDGKLQGVGPTEGDDSLQNDDEDDVWEGGIVSYRDASPYQRKAKKQKWVNRIIGVRDFRRPMIWRAAATELVGTMLWVMFLESVNIGFYTARLQRSEYTGVNPSLLTGIFHMIVLPMMIFATTAASGGHLNPGVTLATFLAGFTKLSRALLYIIAQMIGGILGSAIIWGWLSDTERDTFGAGNCDRGVMGKGRALLMESAAYFWFLFVVFGVAFDPAQRRIYGPVLSPFFLAAILGTIVILTSLVGDYGGAWINPARCFGAAVVSGRFSADVWISIISALIAAVGIAVYYLVIPFNHEFRSRNHRAADTKTVAIPQQQQQQQYQYQHNPVVHGQPQQIHYSDGRAPHVAHAIA